ncbi:GxxExxY protein [bacterium]|nr:GxxExxY protein [bacterium]MBU1754554.1 GxxExxY protein [bacterium]
MEIREYQENSLTEIIIHCIIKVHQTIGPGFPENIYRKAMVIELTKQDLTVETEKEVVAYYEEEEVGKYRLDILVESKVMVELKTVEELSKAHYAQVRSYLKATGIKVAILVNFAKEKADFRRVELE